MPAPHHSVFTQAMLASVGISYRHASICLSVCLLQVGVLPKWLNVGSCKQRHLSPGILVFWRRQSWHNSDGVTPMEVPNAGGVGQMQVHWRLFDTKHCQLSPVASLLH